MVEISNELAGELLENTQELLNGLRLTRSGKQEAYRKEFAELMLAIFNSGKDSEGGKIEQPNHR